MPPAGKTGRGQEAAGVAPDCVMQNKIDVGRPQPGRRTIDQRIAIAMGSWDEQEPTITPLACSA